MIVYRIRELIPPADVQTQTPEGFWVAAHPLPFYGGLLDRLLSAFVVLKGDAYAVVRPQPGEFELAMDEQGWRFSPRGKP